MIPHSFQCPYCWQQVSILLDPSEAHQTFVEDCEVCCNPMEFTIHCEGGELGDFQVRPLGQ
ncbi:CPXCG motif-containing cysteine-rich protein [Robiginitalea marina]|uniref:CPXCG motif-containing cysteine-rich protein n=1 Tax=Robiginitalea marina TaxID=2954105 RepID=A0ABT1B0M5_9FLAO|nr:CPXCG motif-containing cysteine-rich protein [Robiginitalea marina]MCO5725741.1 CPXCG motif-containing cysteine-rich protein [Robiginitalea marina]